MDARQPITDAVVDRSFSLTLAVQSIARDAGCDIDVDDLHAALGLPLFTCAVPAQNDLACWPMYGRDAFLVPAGQLFGLTIREVHPPEAAVGLNRAAEFVQHFEASYRPLIARALENNQPVLAWQGWPGDQALMWGIINDTCKDGVGFTGATPATPDGPTPMKTTTLITPPVQVYVVETVMPRRPEADELLNLALDHAWRMLRGEPSSRFGVLTGGAAFRFWADRIKAHRGLAPVNPVFVRGHYRLAASIVAAHRSAIRFLERHSARAGGKYDSVIKPLAAVCRQVVSGLAGSTDFAAVRGLMATPEGRAKLAGEVATAQTAADSLLPILETHRRTADSDR